MSRKQHQPTYKSRKGFPNLTQQSLTPLRSPPSALLSLLASASLAPQISSACCFSSCRSTAWPVRQTHGASGRLPLTGVSVEISLLKDATDTAMAHAVPHSDFCTLTCLHFVPNLILKQGLLMEPALPMLRVLSQKVQPSFHSTLKTTKCTIFLGTSKSLGYSFPIPNWQRAPPLSRTMWTVPSAVPGPEAQWWPLVL